MFENLFKKKKKNQIDSIKECEESKSENKDEKIFNLTIEQIKSDFSEKCVKINFDCIDESIFISKLGGLPYLPNDKNFPLDENNAQMQLLLQINCKDLEKFDFCKLPKTGILQFFIAKDNFYGWNSSLPAEQTGFKIRYFEKIDFSVKAEDVKNKIIQTEESKSPILEQNVKILFEESFSTISINNFNFDEIFVEIYNKLYGETKIETYFDLENTFIDKITKTLGDFESKISGFPAFCQDDPRCVKAEYKNFDYLLLQLASDATNLQFGDNGIANFFIPQANLQTADFSKVLYNWDCY